MLGCLNLCFRIVLHLSGNATADRGVRLIVQKIIAESLSS